MTTRRNVIRSGAGLLGLLLSPAAVNRAAAQGSAYKFEIRPDSRGEFRWSLKASNGQIIATSGEGYKTKAACRKGIESVKRGAATAAIVELP